MTVPRLRVMDFTQYFMDGRGVAVLPMPATSENIGATTRPFDWMVRSLLIIHFSFTLGFITSQVWTGLGLSVLIISVALYKLNCKNSLVDNQRYKLNVETREKEVSEYVITVLLSQGATCTKSSQSGCDYIKIKI